MRAKPCASSSWCIRMGPATVLVCMWTMWCWPRRAARHHQHQHLHRLRGRLLHRGLARRRIRDREPLFCRGSSQLTLQLLIIETGTRKALAASPPASLALRAGLCSGVAGEATREFLAFWGAQPASPPQDGFAVVNLSRWQLADDSLSACKQTSTPSLGRAFRQAAEKGQASSYPQNNSRQGSHLRLRTAPARRSRFANLKPLNQFN